MESVATPQPLQKITWAPRGNHVGPQGKSRGPPGEITWAPMGNHVDPLGQSRVILRVKDKQTYCLQIYMCVYGVWRFVIEYMRSDYRGTTIIESVTPSQLVAILMILGGAALIYLQYRLVNSAKKAPVALAAEAVPSAEKTEAVEEDEDDDYDYASEYAKKEDDGAEKEPESKDGDVNVEE